jgi:hypothetical protein
MARPIRSITLGLAWRLFLAQAFTVLFAVVALILTWGDKDSWGMDMFTAEAVAKAVHSQDGGLALDEARWQKLDARAGGNLWFAAVDDRGAWLERGKVPAIHAPLLARLPPRLLRSLRRRRSTHSTAAWTCSEAAGVAARETTKYSPLALAYRDKKVFRLTKCRFSSVLFKSAKRET